MEDIGITPEQFEEACNRENHEPIPVQFDQVIIEKSFFCTTQLFFVESI